MTSAIISSSLLFIPPPKSIIFSISKPYAPTPPLFFPLAPLRTNPAKFSQKIPQFWRISAATEDALPSQPPIESTQQIIPAAGGDEGVSTIVSALLFIAFVGLCLLTIGVIYLAVQDFLQKREKDKFEKEEAAKKKKGGKKSKVRARTGPRGFGQKIEEDEDEMIN